MTTPDGKTLILLLIYCLIFYTRRRVEGGDEDEAVVKTGCRQRKLMKALLSSLV